MISTSLNQDNPIKLFHLPAFDASASPSPVRGTPQTPTSKGLILYETLLNQRFHPSFLVFFISFSPGDSLQSSSRLPQLEGKLPHSPPGTRSQARTRGPICLVVSSQFSQGRILGFSGGSTLDLNSTYFSPLWRCCDGTGFQLCLPCWKRLKKSITNGTI